jgi:hypothetical protein
MLFSGKAWIGPDPAREQSRSSMKIHIDFLMEKAKVTVFDWSDDLRNTNRIPEIGREVRIPAIIISGERISWSRSTIT